MYLMQYLPFVKIIAILHQQAETEISAASWAHAAREELYFLLFLHQQVVRYFVCPLMLCKAFDRILHSDIM